MNEVFIENGKISYGSIWEGECVNLQFDPPLEIEWSAYSHNNVVTVYISYDFGMSYKIKPYESLKCGWGYNGSNDKTSLSTLIENEIKFDLFHAFTHYKDDPNYTYLHWALYGNLKDICKVTERYG